MTKNRKQQIKIHIGLRIKSNWIYIPESLYLIFKQSKLINIKYYHLRKKGMDNFHYRNMLNNAKGQKNYKLIQQLQTIEKEIEEDKKKLAERKKLQQQFYEDTHVSKNNPNSVGANKRMNLADQIMNQLLNPKVEPKINNNNSHLSKQDNGSYHFSPNKNIRQQFNINDKKINYNIQNQINNSLPLKNPSVPVAQYEPSKRNQIIDKRELEKQKLQNRNAQQQFPFGNNSRDKERRVKISPERQVPMKDNYTPINPTNPNARNKQKEKVVFQNPFIKDEPLIKQKREQQQKQYRQLLEEQMLQQKRRKQAQRERIKQQQRQKYGNIGSVAPNFNPIIAQSPNQNIGRGAENPTNIVRKRRDPNAQHVPIQLPTGEMIRPSDIEFMKAQVIDFRNKFKRGRINHQQYQRQIKKLEDHYKIKADQFLEEDQDKEKDKDKNVDKLDIRDNNQSDKISYNINTSLKVPSDRNNNISNMQPLNHQQYQNLVGRNKSNNNLRTEFQQPQYNNVSVPIQTINSNVRHMAPGTQSNYIPPSNLSAASNPQQNDYQMQMMFKLFQEFKNIFKMQTQSHQQDKKVLQQTLTKIIPNFNPNLYTQQLPLSQVPQKQYHTSAKRHQKHQQIPQPSESQISSSYIQKSLSGIVNKIPLTKKQKEQDKGDINKDIVKFYQKKYKIKKFKGFQYTQADNQSNIIIPSVSTFLQTKNSQNQLTQAFERDLKNYKKMEKDRNIQIMKEKIKKSKQNSEIKIGNKQQFANQTSNFYKPEQIKKANSLKPQESNPFLKKHISNQSNQSVPTRKQQNNYLSSEPPKSKYNTYENINSPIPKSSEILQQQQYQTESRRIQSPTNALRKINEQKSRPNFKKKNAQEPKPKVKEQQERIPSHKQYPSSRILNIMKTNNQILAKYEMSPSQNFQSNSHIQSNSISSIKQSNRVDSSKDLSGREYFSGHEISPVQRREYQSSMETVRSEEQSAKFQRKNNMDILMMGSADSRSAYQVNYQSPIPYGSVNQGSPTIQSIEVSKRNLVARNSSNYYEQNLGPNITGYSQTVESIDQSSSKLPSFHKPPHDNNRKSSRTVSRKKQSVVRVGSSDNFQKSSLSGIPSEGSRQKSSLLKPPSVQVDNISKLQSPRFDSAVYQSAYQQSIGYQPKVQNKNTINNIRQVGQQNLPIPKTFKQVLQRGPTIQNIYEVREAAPAINIIQKQQSLRKQQSQISEAEKPGNVANIAPKWRSLEQARKIAKECKLKSGQDHNRSSVEQKLSQLQSFMHQGNSHLSIHQNMGGGNPFQMSPGMAFSKANLQKVQKSQARSNRKQQLPIVSNKKKDISKMLDELGEEEYEPDFQSYKQQSQR